MEKARNGDGMPRLLGGSLPVENVQALAASKNLSEIPRRYIRPDIMDDRVCRDDDEIPIVDFSGLLDVQSSENEATKLKLACEGWGFFQLMNHEVPSEVIERMKVDIEEFFRLPVEEKMAVAQLPGSIEGYGQAFVVSEEQKLDWGDMYFLITQPADMRDMRFWPSYPPTFRATLDKYSSELKRVTNCLLGLLAKNLGLRPEKFVSMFSSCLQSVRMNYYPPCPHADKVLGLSPHSGLDIALSSQSSARTPNQEKWWMDPH